MSKTLKKALTSLYGLGVVVCLWQILYLVIKNPLVPSPLLTIRNTIHIIDELLKHLAASSWRIAIALLFSSIVGTLIGVLMGTNNWANRLIAPIVYVLNPLPKIAFLPIFMIFFGLGDAPKIAVIIAVIVFQFIVAAKDACDEIPRALKYSVQTLNLPKSVYLRDFLIEAILPRWFTALRISFGVSVSVLFFGETFMTTYGIGYFIMNRWGVVNYTDMFSGIIILAVFGLVVYGLIDVFQEKVCRWLYVNHE